MSGTIIYNGDIESLYSLMNEKGEVDDDKLFDWLLKSKDLEFDDPEILNTIKKKIRKRKIDKINKLKKET